MMIRYIIDGHNFIHKIPGYLKLLDRDYIQCLKTLYSDLLNYVTSRHITIVLVLDGNSPWDPPDRCPNLTVEYSGSHRSADSKIIDLAKKWSGRQTVVVSDDKLILRSVVALGCRTISPLEFNRLVNYPDRTKRVKISGQREKFHGLTQTEVRWWKKEMERALAEKKKKIN